MKLPCCLHFAAEPLRRNIEAVRPSQRAVVEEYARKVISIAKRLKQRTWLARHRGEVMLAERPVRKAHPELMSANPFDGNHLNHRPILGYARAARLFVPASNYRAVPADAPESIPGQGDPQREAGGPR